MKKRYSKYNLHREDFETEREFNTAKQRIFRQTDPGLNSKGRPQSFAVDHNHETNKVRGLLCHNCNRAEGLLKGNAQALADYLKRYE